MQAFLDRDGGKVVKLNRSFDPSELGPVMDGTHPHGLKGWLGRKMVERSLNRADKAEGGTPLVMTGLAAEAIVGALGEAKMGLDDPRAHMAATALLSSAGVEMGVIDGIAQPNLTPLAA